MAQHDYIISNATFPAVRTDINNALSAIQTTNSGTSRPTGAVAGQLWLDTTSATTPTLKYYDGADDISLATIDHTANTVNWLDSTVSITGLSTTATGTVLTLSDSVNTTTVNLIIDNQKEIRFRETTANGTNYVALKAPASLSADLTFTLPSIDGASGQALVTNGSGVLSFASAGTSWQSVQTTGFTASAGKGYPLNTTSSAFKVTLPASPSIGDTIILVDYAGTFATNNIILGANGNKIEGVASDKALTTNREAVTITYVDSTQGWVSSSGVNYGSQSLDAISITVNYLVIAGGGGGGANGAGGGGAGGYRNSVSGESSGGGASNESSLTLTTGTNYTVTVGAGGASSTSSSAKGASGSNSVFSTITSTGGGGGGSINVRTGDNGGSGGGASGETNGNAGGSGTANQGYAGGTSYFSFPNYMSSGGGGASAVGSNGSGSVAGKGGNGLASSITGSSVTRGGGGGGGAFVNANNSSSYTVGAVGTGGGGSGGGTDGNQANVILNTSGTANTGGGGGGQHRFDASGTYGSGGSGVVIIKYLDSFTVSNTGGGLTFSTSSAGGFKITTFTAGTGNIQFS